MNKVLRQERKFLIGLEENRRLSNILENVLKSDEHSGTDGYIVRSLYFDTLYNNDFNEKEAGVETRRKIRLRVYDPKDNFAVLEIKQKQGSNQLKRSLKISREDAQKLIKGNYSVLLNYNEDFAKECYGIMNIYCYRPKAVVQYNRKAFIARENNIRITFDTNIVATESCFDIFSESLNMYPVFDKYNTVLEVKYNGFLLNYIKDIINQISKSELSVSKYCLSRSVSLNYLFI